MTKYNLLNDEYYEDDFMEEDRVFTVELWVWNSDYDDMGMSNSQLVLEESLKNIVFVDPVIMSSFDNSGNRMLVPQREYVVFVDSDGNEFQRVLTRYPKINYLVQKDGVVKAN